MRSPPRLSRARTIRCRHPRSGPVLPRRWQAMASAVPERAATAWTQGPGPWPVPGPGSSSARWHDRVRYQPAAMASAQWRLPRSSAPRARGATVPGASVRRRTRGRWPGSIPAPGRSARARASMPATAKAPRSPGRGSSGAVPAAPAPSAPGHRRRAASRRRGTRRPLPPSFDYRSSPCRSLSPPPRLSALRRSEPPRRRSEPRRPSTPARLTACPGVPISAPRQCFGTRSAVAQWIDRMGTWPSRRHQPPQSLRAAFWRRSALPVLPENSDAGDSP